MSVLYKCGAHAHFFLYAPLPAPSSPEFIRAWPSVFLWCMRSLSKTGFCHQPRDVQSPGGILTCRNSSSTSPRLRNRSATEHSLHHPFSVFFPHARLSGFSPGFPRVFPECVELSPHPGAACDPKPVGLLPPPRSWGPGLVGDGGEGVKAAIPVFWTPRRRPGSLPASHQAVKPASLAASQAVSQAVSQRASDPASKRARQRANAQASERRRRWRASNSSRDVDPLQQRPPVRSMQLRLPRQLGSQGCRVVAPFPPGAIRGLIALHMFQIIRKC